MKLGGDKDAAAEAQTGQAELSRGRKITVWVLVVLASLIGLVAILTTWVNRQLLDNNAWNNASAKVIRDPQVRSALSTYLVNQLYANVDVQSVLAQDLPPNLARLSGPLAGALRQPAVSAAEFLLERPRVQQLFINASSTAHEKLVNVLENKTGYGISTGNGVVTIDLSELVTQLGTELGIPSAVLSRIPADAGSITVLKSNQLSTAQKAVRAIKALSAFLLILVLVMYAVAIYLARGQRRETLRNVGWAFVIVGLLVVLIRRGVGTYVINAITAPEYRGPVHVVWLIETTILGQIGAATIFYGIVAVLGAWLAGPTAAGTAVRRWIAPVLNERQGVAWFVVGFVYLVLVWWGPTHALRTWWGILLLGGLLAAGVYALRRETLIEFAPGAGATGGGGPSLAGRVSAATARWRSGDRPEASQPAPSTADEIARLASLRDAGLITNEEFAQAKQKTLSS
jgi:hypothetical protein